jgi:hypothetical protein
MYDDMWHSALMRETKNAHKIFGEKRREENVTWATYTWMEV